MAGHPKGGGSVVTLVALGPQSAVALFPDGRAEWLGVAEGGALEQNPNVKCSSRGVLVTMDHCASKIARGALEALAVDLAGPTRTRPSPP
jgi:hypothetical protein